MTEDTITARRVYFGRNPKLHEKTSTTVNGVLVQRVGRRIHLHDREWPIETAEMVGAALLELAEAARAEPDPELLAALMDTLDGALGFKIPGLAAELVARDVLAAFKVEKRRKP